MTLRQFVNFYCNPVPKHDAFHRASSKLSPETLKAVNDLLINAAVDLGVEDGTKLCVDTWCGLTFIIRPTAHCCGMSFA